MVEDACAQVQRQTRGSVTTDTPEGSFSAPKHQNKSPEGEVRWMIVVPLDVSRCLPGAAAALAFAAASSAGGSTLISTVTAF